jgi:hypothetical protein
MTVAARINKDGDFEILEEVNEYTSPITRGLTHHFPFDSRAGCFDRIGGVTPDSSLCQGVNLIEAQASDWRDPASWSNNGAMVWDEGHHALKITGYHNSWLANPIVIDTTKTYQISIEVMEIVESDIGLYLGGVGYNVDGVKCTTNYDYTMAANHEPGLNVWKTYKLTRTGEAVAASGTSTSFDTVKGWSGGAAIADDVYKYYHLGGLFNYSSGGVLYVRNPSIVITNADGSNTTIRENGLQIDETSTNLMTELNATFQDGNVWGTYNTNNYNSNVDYSIGTIGSVTDNLVTLSVVGREIYSYDVINAGTTGGGVTAGTEYLVLKHSATTFSLHAYNATQDGSLGLSVHDSVRNDVRIPISLSGFPTMWHGNSHRPNSGIVKEILYNEFEQNGTFYNAMRCHKEHRTLGAGLGDHMAYGYTPSVTIGLAYSFSFWFRAANKASVGSAVALGLYTTVGWTGDYVYVPATEDWQQYRLEGLIAPATGGTYFYFSQGATLNTIDYACVQMEQKPFPTAFTVGTRGNAYFNINQDVLSPSQGTVVFDVTFHEDGTVNDLQASDQYSANNGEAWNVANSFHFHDVKSFYLHDSDGTRHQAYLLNNIIRNERTQIALVYNDTTGEMKSYKNGVFEGGGTKAFIGKLGSLGTGWSHSGHAGGPNYKMSQTVHDLKFFDVSLTADEIKTLSNKSFRVKPSGDVETKTIVERPGIPSDAFYASLGSDGSDQTNLLKAFDKTADYWTGEAFSGTATTNVYVYPTFDTAGAGGGWAHWGAVGHIGTFGQSTDPAYKYDKALSYSHWLNNAAGATASYLLYQSPTLGGVPGVRALSVILCRDDFGVIDESVCYPVWNARLGGSQSGVWTSVEQLGDSGFYHCKVNNISQNGTDDLVGIYVSAGFKVYFSRMQLDSKYFNTPFFPGTSGIRKLSFNLYKEIGMDWSEDWSICYWKKPIATHDQTSSGYNIDSLGSNTNTVGGGYRWWGKDNGSDTIASAVPLAIAPTTYFNNWQFISLINTGGTLIITTTVDGVDHVRTATTGTTAENYYVNPYGFDFKLGGWDLNSTTNTYFKDLVIVKRAITATEISEIKNTKMRQYETYVQIQGRIKERVSL